MDDVDDDQERVNSSRRRTDGGMRHERTEVTPVPHSILTTLHKLTNTLQDLEKSNNND